MGSSGEEAGFRWRYQGVEGRDAGVSEGFEDAAAAEEWMGTAWSDLLARGVEHVVLVDGTGRAVYRMGLREQ
ncbi:MAG: hypothetical protein M3245_05810 [Actinomycetota bacterium]|nr:hypothetical protein [Actinomycetota bacterium]